MYFVVHRAGHGINFIRCAQSGARYTVDGCYEYFFSPVF